MTLQINGMPKTYTLDLGSMSGDSLERGLLRFGRIHLEKGYSRFVAIEEGG